MGFSPEKRIMGPNMMRSMMMNPLQPMILQYQGMVCPRTVVVVAEQQLIFEVNELRYMLNCLDQSPRVRLVAENVQSIIIFTQYRKGMAVYAETMQQFTQPLLVMRELSDLNYLNPYLICRADRQKQMKQKKEKAMRAGLGEQKEAETVRDALQGARQNTNQQKRQKIIRVQMYLVMTFCRLGTMRMVMYRSITMLATWTSTPMTMSLLNWQYLVAYQRVYPLTSVMRGQKKIRQIVRKICTAAIGGQKSAPIFLQEKTERKEASFSKRRQRLFSIQQAAMLKGLMFYRNSCQTSLYFHRYSLDPSSSLISTRRKAFYKFSTSQQSLNLFPLYLMTSCCRKMTTKRKQRQPSAYSTLPSFTLTKKKNLSTPMAFGSEGMSSICTNSPAKMRRKMYASRRKVYLRLAMMQQQKAKANRGRESRQGLTQQQISISTTISTYRLLRKRATSCTLPFYSWQKLSGRMASLEETSSSMILGAVSRSLYSPSDPTHPTCALTQASTSAMASESFCAMESAATLICSSNSVNSCSSTSQSSLINLQADSFSLWQAVSPPMFWVTQRRVSQQSNARATSVCVQHMSWMRSRKDLWSSPMCSSSISFLICFVESFSCMVPKSQSMVLICLLVEACQDLMISMAYAILLSKDRISLNSLTKDDRRQLFFWKVMHRRATARFFWFWVRYSSAMDLKLREAWRSIQTCMKSMRMICSMLERALISLRKLVVGTKGMLKMMPVRRMSSCSTLKTLKKMRVQLKMSSLSLRRVKMPRQIYRKEMESRKRARKLCTPESRMNMSRDTMRQLFMIRFSQRKTPILWYQLLQAIKLTSICSTSSKPSCSCSFCRTLSYLRYRSRMERTTNCAMCWQMVKHSSVKNMMMELMRKLPRQLSLFDSELLTARKSTQSALSIRYSSRLRLFLVGSEIGEVVVFTSSSSTKYCSSRMTMAALLMLRTSPKFTSLNQNHSTAMKQAKAKMLALEQRLISISHRQKRIMKWMHPQSMFSLMTTILNQKQMSRLASFRQPYPSPSATSPSGISGAPMSSCPCMSRMKSSVTLWLMRQKGFSNLGSSLMSFTAAQLSATSYSWCSILSEKTMVSFQMMLMISITQQKQTQSPKSLPELTPNRNSTISILSVPEKDMFWVQKSEMRNCDAQVRSMQDTLRKAEQRQIFRLESFFSIWILSALNFMNFSASYTYFWSPNRLSKGSVCSNSFSLAANRSNCSSTLLLNCEEAQTEPILSKRVKQQTRYTSRNRSMLTDSRKQRHQMMTKMATRSVNSMRIRLPQPRTHAYLRTRFQLQKRRVDQMTSLRYVSAKRLSSYSESTTVGYLNYRWSSGLLLREEDDPLLSCRSSNSLVSRMLEREQQMTQKQKMTMLSTNRLAQDSLAREKPMKRETLLIWSMKDWPMAWLMAEYSLTSSTRQLRKRKSRFRTRMLPSSFLVKDASSPMQVRAMMANPMKLHRQLHPMMMKPDMQQMLWQQSQLATTTISMNFRFILDFMETAFLDVPSTKSAMMEKLQLVYMQERQMMICSQARRKMMKKGVVLLGQQLDREKLNDQLYCPLRPVGSSH